MCKTKVVMSGLNKVKMSAFELGGLENDKQDILYESERSRSVVDHREDRI